MGIFVVFFCSCSSTNLQNIAYASHASIGIKSVLLCLCLTEIESYVLTYLLIPCSHRETGKYEGENMLSCSAGILLPGLLHYTKF